jgi:tRNA pseudouridine32 synthase/23S rRNA pseudouridine746 synthase
MASADISGYVIYEDAQMLALDKPAGLAVQGGSGVEESLEDLLVPLGKPGKPLKLVHRLDRETSGVLVVARNRTSAAALAKSFETRAAIKTYLAITCRAPSPADGVIETPLKKIASKGVDLMRAAAPGEAGALEAATRYRTLDANSRAALVALMPETGRMHQLRAHLALLGAPIAGDGKYGGLFALGATKIPGLMLHAYSLAIPHPKGGVLNLRAEPPAAFARTAAALGLDPMAGLAMLGARQ